MIRACAVIIMALICSAIAFAEDIKIIEAEGQVTVGDDTTIGQAKASALNNARREALEKATGVIVHGSSTVYNYQLINDLVIAATRGLIVKEIVKECACKTKDEHIYCAAKIEAHVKPLNLERRGSFLVKNASVQRPDRESAAKSAVFQNKDEIQVRVSVNQDSYMNIFSVDQYGNVVKLYPNEYVGQDVLPVDRELIFPDDDLRKVGLKLRVRTPKGISKAVESVLVIATKDKMKLLADPEPANPTITDLMKELSELDPSVWAEKTAGYEVRE